MTTTDNFSSLRSLILELSGIEIGEDRTYLIEARLAPLFAQTGAEDYHALERLIRTDSQGNLRNEFIELITTHETLWFRDHRPWRCIEELILPLFFEQLIQHPMRKIRIWSAAASTGQEAYSLVMLIKHLIDKPQWTGKVSPSQFEIIASDISATTIEKAKEAKYSKIEISRGLPDFYIQSYFRQDGFYSYLNEDVKRHVNFRVFNLMDPFPFGTFDLILCRNVLIYFPEETKLKLYQKFETALKPDGFFLLGGSESMIGYKSPLQRKAHSDAVYFQK